MSANQEHGHGPAEDPSYGEWLWERLLGHPEPHDVGDPIDEDVGCAGPGLPASRVREAQERCEAELAAEVARHGIGGDDMPSRRGAAAAAGDTQLAESRSGHGAELRSASRSRVLRRLRVWSLVAVVLLTLGLAASAWQVWDGTHSLQKLGYNEAFETVFDSSLHMDSRMVALALIQNRIASVCRAARDLPDAETLEVLARIAADLDGLKAMTSAPRPGFGVSIEILEDRLRRRPLDASERGRLDALVRAGIRVLSVATRLESELDGRTAIYLQRGEAAILGRTGGR